MNCKNCIHFKVCDQDGTTAEFAGACAEECNLFEDASYYIPVEHKINDVVFIPCHTKSNKRKVIKGKIYKICFDKNMGCYYVVETAYDDFSFRSNDFGKYIFTDKDDAKNALENG